MNLGVYINRNHSTYCKPGTRGKSIMKDKTGSILTHIDSNHNKPEIFEKTQMVHPKVTKGCYANAEGNSQSDKK